MGFAVAMNSLFYLSVPEFHSARSTFLTLFSTSLGAFDLGVFDGMGNADDASLGLFVYISFIIITTVLFLDVIIARLVVRLLICFYVNSVEFAF